MTIRRAAAAIISLIAWIGLGVQFGATFAGQGSIAATLWIMILYFTIIANLAVAIVFAALAAGNASIASPLIVGGVTITMMLVGLVYNILLHGLIHLSGGARLADFLNHTVTPITVTAFWLLLAARGPLDWSAPLKWALLPLAYFPYGLLRGAAEGRYPYPFMDLQRIGWGRTLTNAAVIATGFAIVGYAMVWLDRRSRPVDSSSASGPLP